jgi:hypothetical protein
MSGSNPDLYTVSESVKSELYRIKPRSVIYLFSGGKDSSLALLLTRDFIRDFCREVNCRVYMLYVYITGNTHPLNAFASYSVLSWHKKHYGFEIITRAHSELFQEYVAKYGLEIGAQRWCFIVFKHKIFRDVESRLPPPRVLIDGMSPGDSKVRSEKITSELQLVETSANTRYYSWHPLFSVNLSSEEKLKILELHEEFKPVVELYKVYGDSLNCVLCPYKSINKLLAHHRVENLSTLYYFVREVLLSRKWRRKYSRLHNKTLEEYIYSSQLN